MPALDLASVTDLPVPAILRAYDVSSDEGERLAHQQFMVMQSLRRATSGKAAFLSFSDQESEPYIEPTENLAKKHAQASFMHLKALAAAKKRIEELKALARVENYVVSSGSEDDLRAFLDAKAFTRRPYITLLDNGNLRALWKNGDGEQIGLQFRGDERVQYVLFARRPNGNFFARSSGRDTLENIDRQIEADNLVHLMTA